jgi:putative ABC transport system permease protein
MLNLVKINKVYNQYSNEPQVTALENISLSFPATGMFFVTGKSGSGKSTLLNIIGGLDTPTSGKMIIDGVSTENFSEKDWDSYRNEYIGFVFQEYHLLDELTVSENIALALQLKNENKGSQEKVSQVLTMVGLDGMGKQRINTFLLVNRQLVLFCLHILNVILLYSQCLI